jgi:hypothetical protein
VIADGGSNCVNSKAFSLPVLGRKIIKNEKELVLMNSKKQMKAVGAVGAVDTATGFTCTLLKAKG